MSRAAAHGPGPAPPPRPRARARPPTWQLEPARGGNRTAADAARPDPEAERLGSGLPRLRSAAAAEWLRARQRPPVARGWQGSLAALLRGSASGAPKSRARSALGSLKPAAGLETGLGVRRLRARWAGGRSPRRRVGSPRRV